MQHLFGCEPVRRTDSVGAELVAREGEIIGLAGLAGHGQTELLRRIFLVAGAGAAISMFVVHWHSSQVTGRMMVSFR